MNEDILPQLRADAQAAAGAVSRVVSPIGSMIKKAVGAVKRAIGQTPPTAQEIRQFLDAKGIPFTQAEQLIKWGVMPHTKLTADALGLNTKGNSDHWNEKLSRFIPDPRKRQQFIQPFVEKNIGIWLPLVESDSVS